MGFMNASLLKKINRLSVNFFCSEGAAIPANLKSQKITFLSSKNNANTSFSRKHSSSPEIPTYISRQEALKEIYEKCKTSQHPFFAKDMGAVCRQSDRWKDNLPDIRPFYAVKCNPDPVILNTLAKNGVGFDCATSAEIETALSTGVSPDDIIFANPVKNHADIAVARSRGVKKMTFDNESEIYKIQSIFPEASLVLRLLPDDSGSVMRFGSKFGASEEVVPHLLSLAHSLGMNVIGVSFHIGSGCYNPTKYDDALLMCRRVFDKTLELGLPPMHFLDIGGGFPGKALGKETKDDLPFETFASVIRNAQEKYFPLHEFPHLQKIGEPGRYFASHCGVLFTQVTGRRVEPKTKSGDKKVLYYINDGVYGSFNCIMYDYYNPVPVPVSELIESEPVRELEHTRTFAAFHTVMQPQAAMRSAATCFSTQVPTNKTLGTFFGPTCDSLDKICQDFPVSELQVGDWVAFEDMGAYTSAAASRFNGVPLADVNYCYSLAG